MKTRVLRIVAVVAVLAAIGIAIAFVPPSGPRSIRVFEPDRLADLEVEMWKAYYAKENARLVRLLVVMLREQYDYSWATATREALHLARAAAGFGNARGDYQRFLPDLEAAYGTARAWLGASFDPAAVARAELAWWVARRIPGQNSPEQVGALIAAEYALLYESTPEAMLRTGVLRARAGRMRDEQAPAPDWSEIRRLLGESYHELHRVVGENMQRR